MMVAVSVAFVTAHSKTTNAPLGFGKRGAFFDDWSERKVTAPGSGLGTTKR